MSDEGESVRLPLSRGTTGDEPSYARGIDEQPRRAPGDLLADLTGERPTPPPRVLLLSLLCLGAAFVATSLWPEESQRLAGFVWSLALIPVFLLSYYRGWRGAATAAAGVLAAMVLTVVIRQVLLGRGTEPWIYGVATGVVIPATLGAGAVTEVLHRKRELAVALAYRDPLTGLANRRLLREHLERMLAHADRTGAGVGLLVVDLARFRNVNERFGETAGDRALQAAGDRLRKGVRGADTVARIGGDEFAVGLTDVGSAEELAAAAQRLRSAFSDPIHLGDVSVHLKPLVGAAHYPDDGSDPDQLLAAAEQARPGPRTPHTIGVSPAQEERGGADRLALAEDLRAADQERDIGPWFQIIYDCGGLAPRAAEALSRWRHPRHGLLSAGQFVAVAEQTGLIRRIDRKVLRAAARLTRDWCSGISGWAWRWTTSARATPPWPTSSGSRWTCSRSTCATSTACTPAPSPTPCCGGSSTWDAASTPSRSPREWRRRNSSTGWRRRAAATTPRASSCTSPSPGRRPHDGCSAGRTGSTAEGRTTRPARRPSLHPERHLLLHPHAGGLLALECRVELHGLDDLPGRSFEGLGAV